MWMVHVEQTNSGRASMYNDTAQSVEFEPQNRSNDGSTGNHVMKGTFGSTEII